MALYCLVKNSLMRIAINGFGRIGRCVLRALHESNQHPEIQVVAINEPADLETIAHLLKFDSTHGRFTGKVEVAPGQLVVDGQPIVVSHVEVLSEMPWSEQGIDLVMECSGTFTSVNDAREHCARGATKVLFSQPADADVDTTIVYGYNESSLNKGDTIISNASCTTNCIVPVIDVLVDAFGITSGVITTIHSAMNDQPVIDAYHHTDLRKTRAAMQSIIPIDTELARGIERLMPAMAGRFSAQALRVPTVNVSAMDISLQLEREASVDAINAALQVAAEQRYAGILDFTLEPLASCDFNHDTHSGIVDGSQTRVAGHLVKVLVWFDNEWGFANRMLDVASHLARL